MVNKIPYEALIGSDRGHGASADKINISCNIYIYILLMDEILHQLRLVVDPIIYRVLYIPGGCLGFLP